MTSNEGLKVALHPLPILNISEHWVRVTLQQNDPNIRIIGGLLGTQLGRDIEIMNTFELVYQDEGLQLDHGYFVTRAEQFKQVFPSFDFLGWYSVGAVPTPQDIELHKQFFTYNETPLFVQLAPPASTAAPTGSNGKDLPVTVYESNMEIIDNEPQVVLRAVEYEIETGEAERVAVDHVSTASAITEGAQSSLIANLTTQRNALKMLHDRVHVIVQYLSAVSIGAAPRDDETLRHISALVSSLQPTTSRTNRTQGAETAGSSLGQPQPRDGGHDLQDEFLTEYNDVLLTTYLATLTKQLSSTNLLLDKQLVAVANNERGPAGVGGRGGNRRKGGDNV